MLREVWGRGVRCRLVSEREKLDKALDRTSVRLNASPKRFQGGASAAGSRKTGDCAYKTGSCEKENRDAVCREIGTHFCLSACVFVCVRIGMRVCLYVRLHTSTRIYSNLYKHAHTYKYQHIFACLGLDSPRNRPCK